jgi:1A family penicillin-binding protein
MSTARNRLLLLALVTGVGLSRAHGASAQNSVRVGSSPPPAEVEAWQIIQPPQSSLVYGRDGSLIGEIGREMRTSVPLHTLPPYLPHAFIAVEDQRFYKHNGVDPVGLLGALKDAATGHVRGASTITQLLVGNMHPDIIDRRDRSLGRKLREQEAALEMEKHYTKEQILEAFLNQLDFGHGWFGVEAAARHYFGKSASRLSLAEAASLAAMPKSPTLYDPIRSPARNKSRRDLILGLMADQGYIAHDAAEKARHEPVVTVPDAGMSAPSQYFADAVRQAAQRAGIPVGTGGYRIYTTLDPVLQRAAVDALVDGTDRVEARANYRHPTYAQAVKTHSAVYLQGAVVAIDPATGDVRAFVGGRNYAASPFDRVFALRQPGSAIKPLVYAAALSDSIPANAIVADTALSIPMPSGPNYEPGNADGQFLGLMTVHEALVRSRNPVAVQLGMRVGIDTIAELARRLGIASPIAPVPSSAIGASVVRPLELVTAYTAFANLGSVVQPRLITRIDDPSGHTAYAAPVAPLTPVLDPRVTFIVRRMMEDVAERGTGAAARQAVPSSIPVAGKTGTTNDNADVWFVGMTPDLVAAVWLGFDQPATIAPGAAGGSLAAPIWGQMIARYYKTLTGAPSSDWSAWSSPPPGLLYAELDRETGALADSTTPPDRRYVEFFLDGTEPLALKADPWRLPQFGPLVFY